MTRPKGIEGFTLLEVVVALAIGILIVLGIISVVQMIGKLDIAARMQNARDTIVNNIRKAASNPHAMNYTMTQTEGGGGTNGNQRILYCVNGDETGATNCTNNDSYTFDLYDNSHTQIAGGASPVVYSIDGLTGTTYCPNGATLTCPILASTYFIVRCPVGGGGCGVGPSNNVTIEVHYSVYQSSQSYTTAVAGNTLLQTVNSPPVPISGLSIYNAP